MNTNDLYNRINSLSIMREYMYEPIIESLTDLLSSIRDGDDDLIIMNYGSFAAAIYDSGGDLGIAIKDLALSGNDAYINMLSQGAKPGDAMRMALRSDLATLDEAARITPQDLIGAMDDAGSDTYALPMWDNTPVDIPSEYMAMLDSLDTTGYGIFRDHIMFRVECEELIPIEAPAYKDLDSFYGYSRERDEVIKNTEVFAGGRIASNVLLYGDAGTGKSSTVKACAAAFADRGVRLVEFNKSQVDEIPAVAEVLRKSPLKFIFYIDDLSFTDDDDDFYLIKGILEGSVRGEANNILIYATSNRRHLVRESMEDRYGDDIHLNDTLQEIMSVSARFGLTVTFQKPDRDLYLSIVKELADEYSLEYDNDEDLFRRAEAFAIRANGRSPRTAKQFVILAKGGIR